MARPVGDRRAEQRTEVREAVGLGDHGPEQRQAIGPHHGPDDPASQLRKRPAQLFDTLGKRYLEALEDPGLRVLDGKPAEHGREERLLVPVVAVERLLGDPGFRGNGIRTRGRKPPPGEYLLRPGEELIPLRQRPGGQSSSPWRSDGLLLGPYAHHPLYKTVLYCMNVVSVVSTDRCFKGTRAMTRRALSAE